MAWKAPRISLKSCRCQNTKGLAQSFNGPLLQSYLLVAETLPKQLKIMTALLQDSVVWRLFVNLLSFPRTFYIFMTPTWAQISWSLFLERFGKLKVDSLRIIQPLAGQDAATDNFARWWLVSNSSKAICKYYIISQFHILHHVVYHIMSNHIVSYPTSYYTSYHILSNHIVQHIVHYIVYHIVHHIILLYRIVIYYKYT